MSSTDRTTSTFKHPVSSQIMRDTWHDHPTLTFLDYHKQEDGNLVWETSMKKTKNYLEEVWNMLLLGMQELPMSMLKTYLSSRIGRNTLF